MGYSFNENFTLYRLEQVQKELGIYDLLDWSRLISGYELNPAMVTYQGFTGMEENEKDRIVHELKERLAAMPGIKPSLPLKKTPYPYSKVFNRIGKFYSFDNCIAELNIGDQELLRKIMKDYQPDAKTFEVNGQRLMSKAEKEVV